MTPTALAAHENVKVATLTRLLAELEHDNWILREAHPTDGRQSILRPTSVGISRLTASVFPGIAALVAAMSTSATSLDAVLETCEMLERLNDTISNAGGNQTSAARAEPPTGATSATVVVEALQAALISTAQGRAMSTEPHHFTNVALPDAQFTDVNLRSATFENIDLAQASFTNVTLAGARFDDVNMSAVAITNAKVEGMAINGMLVSELLRRGGEHE